MKDFKRRLLSIVLSVVVVASSFASVSEVVRAEETLSTSVTCPFSSTASFELNGNLVTSNSYRIPAMVTLEDGTIVAAADIRWNTTYDGGGLDTLVARSTDGGVTWERTLANYLGDNGNEYNGSSTCFIDPSLTVAADGQTVYMLCDLYPYGVALNGDKETEPVTTEGFNDNGYLKLRRDNHSSYSYYLKDGKIYDSSNNEVSGYTVDEYFNLYKDGVLTSNLFYSDSPYKVVRTGFLYLTKSTNGGATWSEPTLIDVDKADSSERVCLVGPGRGLTTSDGTMVFPVYSYGGSQDSQRTGFIYSKDGVNWERTDCSVSWSSEAAVVEIGEGTLRFFYRNGTANLCYVDYDLNAKTWGSAVNTGVDTNSNTQISAITYSKTSDGKQVVLVSCPTGPNAAGSDNNNGGYRLNGRIFTGVVESNGTMTWNDPINVNGTTATSADTTSPYTEAEGFFAYSCLTERSDGSIALLYENRENAWGTGSNCYYAMNFKAYSSSELGLEFDSTSEGGDDEDNTGDNDGTDITKLTNIVSSNGVTVAVDEEIFSGIEEVATLTAPRADYIKNARAYNVVPLTPDGEYKGAARVTIAIPDGWNKDLTYGYVKETDGSLTTLVGTVSDQGTITFTTPHFSEIGIFEATKVLDSTIVLEIGETSPTVTVSDSSNEGTAGTFTTSDETVEYTVTHVAEGGTEVTKVNSLSAGNTVVISDGNGNYLMRDGNTIKSTTDISKATEWTVAEISSGWITYYTLSNDEYYLRSRNARNKYSLNISNSPNNTDYRHWSYDASKGFYYSNHYLNYNNEWSVDRNINSGYGAAYSVAQGEEKKETTATFTGLDVTTGTEVTIGSNVYTIIVNPKATEETKLIVTGKSTELDALTDLGLSGSGYSVSYVETADADNVITVNGNAVTAGSTTGDATVVATVTNASGNTVGTVTYNITVSDIVVTDVERIYVPVNGTAIIEGLSGDIHTGMFDEGISTYEVGSDGTVTFTGVKEGKTSLVVGTTQVDVYVNPENTGSGADKQMFIYINVARIENCDVYYAINGGTIYEVEGTGELINQTYTDGFNIMFFATPHEGYALTEMKSTNSDDQYYVVSDGTRPDGSDSSAWPFNDPDATTIPTSNSDSAWVSGHGFRWCLLEGNMDIDDMRDLFTRALALGADGVTTFTKNSQGNNLNTELAFVAEKLPEFNKEIISVNGSTYVEGTKLNFGDVITYKFTVTSKSTNVYYSEISLTDSSIGYTETIEDNTFNSAGTYTYTATYTIKKADIGKYTGGTFTNKASINYSYKSTYSKGNYTYSDTASVSCKINGFVNYIWEEGLPSGIVGDTVNYPLPDSELVDYGDTVTVKHYEGEQSYEVVEDGITIGTWTFKGWVYNGSSLQAGTTMEMPNNDSIDFIGDWEYTPAPTYTVTYEWTNAPDGVTLPTDSNSYYSGQTYAIDDEYSIGTTKANADGSVTYTFSGWKLGDSVVEGDKTMGNSNVTLKGEWISSQNLADMTIVKAGILSVDHDGEDISADQEGQSTIFEVLERDTVVGEVVIYGNDSIKIKNLTVGKTYTVREKTDWSWRYDPIDEETRERQVAQTITIETSGNIVIFNNERTNIYWLNGGTYESNLFSGFSN